MFRIPLYKVKMETVYLNFFLLFKHQFQYGRTWQCRIHMNKKNGPQKLVEI